MLRINLCAQTWDTLLEEDPKVVLTEWEGKGEVVVWCCNAAAVQAQAEAPAIRNYLVLMRM